MAGHGRFQPGYSGFAVLAGEHQRQIDDIEKAIKELSSKPYQQKELT